MNLETVLATSSPKIFTIMMTVYLALILVGFSLGGLLHHFIG